jgi:hypothetical protein
MLSYFIGSLGTGVVTNWEARVAAVSGVFVEPAVNGIVYYTNTNFP